MIYTTLKVYFSEFLRYKAVNEDTVHLIGHWTYQRNYKCIADLLGFR